MAAAAAMQTSHPAQPGAPALLVSDQAISAPMAPTAPKARYSTPVARYSTTSPTPDRAYTPPRARPLTINGSKSDQGGTNRPYDAGSSAAVPAALRYAAICGSTAEISVQPWAVTILPLSGVTVESSLFGMCVGELP